MDLLGRIRTMDDGFHSFETRTKLLIQVLDEAKEFDDMDDVDRCSHLVAFGIEPFIPA